MWRPSLLLVALALVATACDDGGDAAAPEPAPTVTVTVTDSPSPVDGDDSIHAEDGCQTLQGGDQFAFVFVTTPRVGASVAPGFEFAGCSNSFEAAFQWALRDGDGNVLADGFGTATCGTGCVGTFQVEVPYRVDEVTVGSLEVWTSSAKDGSKLDVNQIPLLLTP